MRAIRQATAVLIFTGALGAAQGDEPRPAAPAPAAPARAAPATPEVWEGYVWKDKQGQLEFGRGVVAMGVMALPAHVIAGPLAAKLLPYAAGDDSWLFWNYELERPEPKTLVGLPTVLVRLEGVVEEGENPDPHSFPSQAPRTMKDARLRAVEFLNPDWLRDWAFFFREPISPFRVAALVNATPEEHLRFAQKALEVLRTMRSRPGPTDVQKAEAKALEPTARVVSRFREGEETDIQRWLLATTKEHGWTLAGLEALPPLPPASTEIQGWFLDSDTREAFLAKAKACWSGDPARLVLVHYVETENSTSYTTTDLEEIREHWTEAEFQARKLATGRMGVRR
jgi:hypothetical protein